MTLTGTQHVLTGHLVLLCTALIVALCPASAHGLTLPEGTELHEVASKRSFVELSCRGVFDMVVFGELSMVCQECYTLYKEPELHGLCRSECFTTQYFQGCLQALLRTDEVAKFDSYIRRTSGRK